MGPERITELARPLAAAAARASGVELVDVQFRRERGRWVLQVVIDKEDGVSLADCQAVSEDLGARLDEADPIPGPYGLEVSSPGPNRPLTRREDFVRFAGRRVELRVPGPGARRKRWKGKLLGLEGDSVLIEVDGERRAIPLEQVARARLAPGPGEFPRNS